MGLVDCSRVSVVTSHCSQCIKVSLSLYLGLQFSFFHETQSPSVMKCSYQSPVSQVFHFLCSESQTKSFKLIIGIILF